MTPGGAMTLADRRHRLEEAGATIEFEEVGSGIITPGGDFPAA